MTESSPFLTTRGGACEVYLLRHGDATPEPGGVIVPSYDDQPLNARGRLQAEALGDRRMVVTLNDICHLRGLPAQPIPNRY